RHETQSPQKKSPFRQATSRELGPLDAFLLPTYHALIMTGLDSLRSPLTFLQSSLTDVPLHDVLDAEQAWWKSTGVGISDAIDRAGTPWLRVFDRLGKRVDEILYPPEYQTMLRRGYQSGVVWRALEEKSLIPTYLLLYTISFHDPGICCPYTVSLGTAVPLAK